MKYRDIEIGQVFRFNCMYWRKEGSMAKMISDDVYESGKDTFVPGVGHKATINEDREVELITKKTKYE